MIGVQKDGSLVFMGDLNHGPFFPFSLSGEKKEILFRFIVLNNVFSFQFMGQLLLIEFMKDYWNLSLNEFIIIIDHDHQLCYLYKIRNDDKRPDRKRASVSFHGLGSE